MTWKSRDFKKRCFCVSNGQIFAQDEPNRSVLNRAKTFYQNYRCLRNDRPLKIRLLQCYCMKYFGFMILTRLYNIVDVLSTNYYFIIINHINNIFPFFAAMPETDIDLD